VEAKTIQLRDKRKLAYAEYGKPDGVPVFYFHGTPGSRLLPSEDIALVERLGVRLVAPDRPGFGMSDFQPDRQFLDWPDDMVELMDGLGIRQCNIVGFSGGGPYVAACAYKISERLTRVVMGSSPAPFNAFGEPSQLRTPEEFQSRAQTFAEEVRERPDEMYQEMLSSLPTSDCETLMRPDFRVFMIATFQEALRNGIQGYVHENLLLFTRSWGFSLEAITAEVHIWHGESDSNVVVDNAHYLNQHIPNSIIHLLPGIGHLLPLRCWEEICGIFV
jgi:pimeloyl-ACP methyl ester carboxylesterase